MSEATNNQDRHEAIKAEIATRVAAGQRFDDLLAMLSAPAAAQTPKPSKGRKSKAEKSRRNGQVLRRGEDKYLIRIFLGRDTNGKRHYHSETFLGKKRAADDYLRELLTRKKVGDPLRQSDDTFDTFLDEWLSAKRQSVRERTHSHYTKLLTLYIRPALGKRRLIDVMAADIQAVYEKMLGEELSSSTAYFVHTILTNVFKLAVKRDKIRKNPMLGVEPPRLASREMSALDAGQIRLLLAAAQGRRESQLFTIAFYTGARPCEYLALKWTDVDLQAKTITIRRSLVWRKAGDWYITEPKTEKSKRTLPLSAAVIAALQEQRKRQLEDKMKIGRAWPDHGFIFADEAGEPMTVGATRYLFRHLLRMAGLPAEIRLYDVRHSTATHLIASGYNAKVVSERLGHSNIAITLETYTHVSAGMQKEASEEMEKVISG
jgi:integrase